MKRFATLSLSVFFVALYLTNAQATSRVWVSLNSTAPDPDGSYLKPYRSFDAALQNVTAGGEVICLDAGAFWMMHINKSVTINCEGTIGTNSVLNDPTTEGVVEIYVGPTDVVVLRGLDLDFHKDVRGVYFFGAGTLIIDKARIANSNSSGVLFAPSGPANLVISDSLVTGNGAGSTGAGIRVYPTATGSARVTLEHLKVSGNVFGVAFDGTNSVAGINATIANSTISSNTNDGIIAVTSSGHSPIGVTVIDSRSTNNPVGIHSVGPNVTLRVKNSEVIGNNNGLVTSAGAAMLSAGSNTLEANGNNGGIHRVVRV